MRSARATRSSAPCSATLTPATCSTSSAASGAATRGRRCLRRAARSTRSASRPRVWSRRSATSPLSGSGTACRRSAPSTAGLPATAAHHSRSECRSWVIQRMAIPPTSWRGCCAACASACRWPTSSRSTSRARTCTTAAATAATRRQSCGSASRRSSPSATPRRGAAGGVCRCSSSSATWGRQRGRCDSSRGSASTASSRSTRKRTTRPSSCLPPTAPSWTATRRATAAASAGLPSSTARARRRRRRRRRWWRRPRKLQRPHGSRASAAWFGLLLLLLLVVVLSREPEQPLHLEHVPSARVGARLERDCAVGARLAGHRLGQLEGEIGLALPPDVEQPDAEAEEAGERLRLERRLLALHQRRDDCLRDVLVARAGERQAERERRHRDNLEGRVQVGDDRHELLEHLRLARAEVGEAEAQQRPHLELRRLRARLDVVVEERERRVALVPHAAVEDADGKQRARLDVGIAHVEKLVDLREPAVDVPAEERAEGGGGGGHAVLLVLVEPLVALGQHQLVRAEAEVDKRVDEGGREVGARRVDGGGRGGALLEVRLVDVVRCLWLEDVQVASELVEVLRQVRPVHHPVELLRQPVDLWPHALPREHVGHLLGDEGVVARRHDLGDGVVIPQPEGEPHRLREAAQLAQDGDGHLQHLRVLGLGHVGGDLHEVEDDPLLVGLVDVRG
mmetsp:Transcript_37568/g.122884  ORF Transcript_37568/g.122884 Transcript_37568/m.122884 type:complete len:681 (+) Transcript_37568:407-2449(+)